MIKQSAIIKLTTWVQEAASEQFTTAFAGAGKLAALFSPFVLIFSKMTNWTLENQDYILIVLGAIAVDYFAGVWKHILKRTFSWRENATGLVLKIALTVGGGFLFEGLNFLVKDNDVVMGLFKMGTRIVVFLYPAASALKNISVLSGGKFPPIGWFERQKAFEKSLNPKDLIKKDESDM